MGTVKNRVRAMLDGVGSLFDFCPDPQRYLDLVPKGTAEERLRGHWERVEQYFWTAAREVESEQEAEPKTREREGASRR